MDGILLYFEKRDVVLIAGIILVMIGLIPFMAPVYALIIGILLYFGIKVYAGRKRGMIEKEVGEGICMECGFTIFDKKCPNCDVEK
jgi:flagellar biosynthesis component FlhA